MIKIILPKNNTNLTKDLSDQILQDVCAHIFGNIDYEVEYESRRTGRYIKIVNDVTNEIHFVCFSNPNNNSRNAGLMQFVSPSYVEYEKHGSSTKYLDIYLLDQSGNDRTNYIKMFYRCFATIGVRLLNLEGVSGIVPFNSYEDLKSYRNQTSGRNTRNRSTYFTDDGNQISIYGKTFGANAMESFILSLTIKKIADKPVVFYPVVDNESKKLSRDQQRILIKSGVSYGDIITLMPNGYARATRDTSRNQSVFKYNLLQKYGDQQCYLCSCDVEHMVIASHIERVTDIDKSIIYTPDQKAERSTDSDNGLWLCANHDKMFEYGIIYFDNSLLKIRSFIIDEQQRDFIKMSIFEMRKVYLGDSLDVIFHINKDHYNEKMHQYINKHLERHGIATI